MNTNAPPGSATVSSATAQPPSGFKVAPGPTYFRSTQVANLINKPNAILKESDPPLYEHFRSPIQAANTSTPVYDPYLYESLMADVAKLLDRCLANRRECSDLEAQGVRRALEYDLFEN